MKRTNPNGASYHGPGYDIWAGMRYRCNNPKSTSYKYYGGRGIKVCERWRFFSDFLADMGRPPPGKSLDRINNDGDYEPGNCRWATPAEQSANRRPRSQSYKERVRAYRCDFEWQWERYRRSL